MKKTFTLFVFCLTMAAVVNAQTPSITSVTTAATSIGRYEKFEATVVLNGSITNPYDYD